MTKSRSDSMIGQLTEPQRTTLYEWIEQHSYDETISLAAKPAPDGFGLTFHKTTLQRWFQQERKHRNLQEIAARAANMDLATDPFAAQSQELNQLVAAAKAEFAHAIYELAQAATDPENFDRLERALHHAELRQIKRQELALARDRLAEMVKIKEQELLITRERLAENRRQWQFNAARTAIEYNMELQKILKNDKLDNEDTIWAANDVCFGPVPRRINSDTLEASSPLSPKPTVQDPTTPPQDAAAPKHIKTHSGLRPEMLSKRSGDPDSSGSTQHSELRTSPGAPKHTGTHCGFQNPEMLSKRSGDPDSSGSTQRSELISSPGAPKHAETHSGGSAPIDLSTQSSALSTMNTPSILGTEAQRAPKHTETHSAPSASPELIAHRSSLSTPANADYLPPFASLPSLECTD